MRRSRDLIVFASLCWVPPALAQTATATQILAQEYCAAVIANDEVAAEALMNPMLRQAIALARVADAAYEKAHPGDKPPLGDGLPLTGFPDSVQSCAAEVISPSEVVVTYAPDLDPATFWRDRLIVDTTGASGPLIADIRFAPDEIWTLVQTLQEITATK